MRKERLAMKLFSRSAKICALALSFVLLPQVAQAEPVSLHFQDAEIADALQAVARFGG